MRRPNWATSRSLRDLVESIAAAHCRTAAALRGCWRHSQKHFAADAHDDYDQTVVQPEHSALEAT